MYGAWYVNKQLLGVCSLICKQTISVYVTWYLNKQLLDVCSLICKQTITGGM